MPLHHTIVSKRRGQSVVAPEDRPDAVAVWDMITLSGSNVANIVASSSEYDLVLSNTVLSGTNPTYNPQTEAEGLVFPLYNIGQENQAKAAGTGTASITSAFTAYCAFTRAGLSAGGTAGFTTLLDTSVFLASSPYSENAPKIATAGVSPDQLVGRWDDEEQHFLCVCVEAGRVQAWLDGSQIMDISGATTFPITLTKFNISELVNKSFVGTVYWAGAFNTAHNAATRADIFSQVAATLAARGVTIGPSESFVAFEGDSIWDSNYIVGVTSQSPYLSLTTLSPIAPAICTAVAGNVVADFTARAAALDGYFAESQSTTKVLCVLNTNDIQVGGDAAVAYASLIGYLTARKAATPGLIIIVGTAIARDVAGYEADRLAFNTLINAGNAAYDYVADFGADLYLGDDTQADISGATTYFADGVHPTAAGHLRMRDILKPILFTALGIVAPPGFTNLKTYASGGYVYDPVDDIPTPRTSITITGGAGWTPGVYTVTNTYPAFATPDGNFNVYAVVGSVGTHPLTGGLYTL